MKVEHLIDGLSGCHDGLRDDLTPKNTYQTVVTDL